PELDALCEWPQDCKRRPRVVVGQHRLDTGPGPAPSIQGFREFDHRYAGDRRDRLEGRWLGFSRHEVTEHLWRQGQRLAIARRSVDFANLSPDPQLATTPLAGEPSQILEQRLDPDTGLLHASHVSVAHEVVATSAHSFVVRQDHSLARTWETSPCAAGFCTLVELSPLEPLTQQVHLILAYDEFSQPLHERSVVSNAEGDLITVVERQIGNDVQRWLLGRVTREILTSHVGEQSVAREQLRSYAPETGALSLEIRQPGDAALFLQTRYQRDDFGNVVAVESSDAGAHTRSGTIDYDPRGVHAIAVTNTLGHVSELVWREGLDVVAALRSPLGTRTVFDHDGLGRSTGVRVFAGVIPRGDDVTLSYDADADSPLRVHTRVRGHGERRIDHDRLGRVGTEAWLGPDGLWREQTRRYDALGNLAEQTLPAFSGQLAAGAEAWQHDILGRPRLHQRADGSSEQWSYQGKLIHHLDEGGKQQRLRLDGTGRVVEAVHAPGSPDEERLCLDYGSFSALQVVRPDCIDPGSDQLLAPGEAPALAKVYDYDDLGRLVSSFDPAEGPRDYVYDAFGNMRLALDGNGQLVEYEHDALGRLLRRVDDDGEQEWIWDQQGPGLLDAAISAGVVDEYGYDLFGRLTTSQQVISGEPLLQSLSYDDYGRPATLSYPGHPQLPPVVVQQHFGADGSLVAVSRDGQPLWSAEEYDAAGHIVRERFGNGLETLRAHDPLRGDLIGLHTTGPDPEPLQDLRYRWNPIGTLAEREDLRGGSRETLSYDDLHRLIASTVTGPQQQQIQRHFAYDAQGN
ncbi:MAG: RHS repeat protein, partial [Myxococcales bacterium]|nr:RHS repeat protein [Myxococcales bacterium]